MSPLRLVPKITSTLHDFPYSGPGRKCLHCWIINVTPAGPNQCIHNCIYCYAREAVYSNYSSDMLVYNNLPELVECDLNRIRLCPPILISTVTDPCQDIPELKKEVKRLVEIIMKYGASFLITTKGDPSFLLDIPGFASYQYKAIGFTIEGNPEILRLLSPSAPSFKQRLAAVTKMAGRGIKTVVRMDPLFPHLFKALYSESRIDEIESLISLFRVAGVKHIIASTGRLQKKQAQAKGCSGPGGSWNRIYRTIAKYSTTAAGEFEKEYPYNRSGTAAGYMWRKDLRLQFHRQIRQIVESNNMTYATCQELEASESDSQGIPHCEGFLLPFGAKQPDGGFAPIPGCTANCHVSCRNNPSPPCGQPRLISHLPFKISCLK